MVSLVVRDYLATFVFVNKSALNKPKNVNNFKTKCTMDNKDYIDEAIQQAGEPTTITPELVKLDSDRITSDTDTPEEVFLYRLCGTPCFPRGDLTTVTGPAKSGKTYFISMLMTCAVSHEIMGLERIREEPLKVLWYDTEQSRYTTKRILVDRVGKMIDGTSFPDEQFYVFNVRNRSTEERMEYLTQAIETYKPDICIIDGIADLLDDINNGPKSLEVMYRLLALAAEQKCNITSVIHLNRSGEKLNLRGWIGTVMVQKSYEVFNCDKQGKTDAFTTELTFSRRFRKNDGLCFEIDDNGLPVASNASRQSGNGQGRSGGQGIPDKQTFNQEFVDDNATDPYFPWDFRKLFETAFGTVAMLGYDDLGLRVKELGNIKRDSYYEKLYAEAERRRIVRKELTKGGRVGVILLPPS